ncbi:MAG: lysophospholipid acyltransferase family protein [Gemmatimonadaceae bacterium]
MLRVVPVGPVRVLAAAIASGAYLIASGRRRTVLESLSYLRPELSTAERRRWARRTFANFGAAAVDLYRLPTASREELGRTVGFEGTEHLDEALARGNGALVISAHLGPYDLGGACLATRGYRTYAVAENLAPEVFDALSAVREATGLRVIGLNRAGTGTYAALKENALVLLLADRVIGERTRGEILPFGSGLRPVPVGPAALAMATGAPIVVAYMCRSKGAHNRYVVHFEAPMFAEGRSDEARTALTRRITARLADVVAEHADEWYVFQPDWRATKGEA